MDIKTFLPELLSAFSNIDLNADTLISENAIIGNMINGKMISLKCYG